MTATGDHSITALERLAALLRQRNETEVEITRIIGRPAQIGHIGEFLAAAIFEIELEGSATTTGHDGRFRDGPFAGKTVNVKFYGRREGLLDINLNHVPEYFLVLAGPAGAAVSSRNQTRPWIVSEVFLFAGPPLIDRLRARGVRIGIATSVRQSEWDAARIYPASPDAPLPITPQQERALALFGPLS